MRLPSHTTVIAYLALFVALGGSAYAVTQLPKNSVGTKQLKPKAVATAKIKNGAVTGAKIATNTVTGTNVDESTLGRVPSAANATSAGHAASATTAANATHAMNAANAASANDAKALGGIPSSGFLQSKDVIFGSGALNACFPQKIVEVPGWFRITTIGDCEPQFRVTVNNLSAESWLFFSEAGSTSVGAGSSSEINFGAGPFVDLFALAEAVQGRHALVDCAFQVFSVPPRISCLARVAPAA